jgi:hypothetical protein
MAVVAVVLFHGFAAGQEVPFKGAWAGKTVSAEPTDDPGVLFITTAGKGHATHLGKFSMVSPHYAELATGNVVGKQIFTAANGDTLFANIVGQFTPTPDGLLTAQIQGTITGGTGRFENARGHYIFSIVFNPATLESQARIDGVISRHCH